MSASCSELDLCERWESSWRFDPSGLLLLSWFHLVPSSQLWPLFCFLKRWKREPNVCCLSHVLNRKISNACDVAGNVLWYSWERADLFIIIPSSSLLKHRSWQTFCGPGSDGGGKESLFRIQDTQKSFIHFFWPKCNLHSHTRKFPAPSPLPW